MNIPNAAHDRRAPVDMILFCPHCNMQHIDAPEPIAPDAAMIPRGHWENPPHRTHLCRLDQGGCGWIWRPSDHATNGVLHLASGHPHEATAPEIERWYAIKYLNTHIDTPMVLDPELLPIAPYRR